MELLVPVDAEQAVIDELKPHFTVGTSIPATTPTRFLRVLLVGGSQRDLTTDLPLLTIEAFAKRESDASDMAATAIARLQLAARAGRLGSVPCYELRIAGLPQNLQLPSLPTHERYFATVSPALRRRAVSI